MRLTDFEPRRVDELAPATLASYKKKAGAAATAADAAGDRKTADRRFSGIVKATKKQFDQDAKGMSEDNLYGGRPDDEVKFFIDSEPAYYAVMDRFGDHIEFRGDDMVAPLRLWGAIQQTAGDAGGAADIAGLEDEPMWVGDELDEQGLAENYPKHQDLSGISTDKLKEYIRYAARASDGLKSYLATQGEGNQVRRVRAELERRMKGVAEGHDSEDLANEVYAEFERIYPNLARRVHERTIHAAIMDVLNYGGDNDPGALAQDVARAVKQQMQQGVAEGAPELLKAEMPLIRHIEQELAKGGWTKDDPEYKKAFSSSLAYYRKFGNAGQFKEQGVAEGSGGNWYIRVNGKILNDTKFKPVIFSSEDEARSHAMKLADKKRIPLSQMKLTKSWMDAPEPGVAEGQQIDEVFADQGSGSTDRDNAEYMKRRRAAKNTATRGSVTKKPQPYNDPNWIDKLSKEQLDALAGRNRNKDKKDVTEMDKSQTPPGRDGDLRSGPDKEAKPISKEKMNKDAADVLDKAMSKEHEKKDVAEDSISAMRRLAGIVPRVPVTVSDGQRQYRHMPTAVQPR